MSTQMGGKKSGGSSNSSMVITPASTPVNTMANGQQASPPPNNAPKYGTLVPNRIFVGGISANTTETELLQLFSNYGTVKAAKIIQDRAGVSKGYGFITFESEDDAKRLQRDQDNIVLRERKLNIAPAIKKQLGVFQPFSRAFDGSSPPAVAPGFAPNFFPPGSMPFFQGGLAYYPQPPTGPADPATQPPAVFQTPSVYPPQSAPPQASPYQQVMYPPQPIYVPQQYPMPMPCDFSYFGNGGAGPYIGGNGGGQNGGAQQQAITQAGQMPPARANSPPRQHCYAQPMPNSAAGAAYPSQDIYYNLPMYQVDTIYAADQAAFEAMAIASGVVQDDYPQHQHQPPPQDDFNTSQQSKGGAGGGGGVVMRAQHPPRPSSQPPTPQSGGERQTSTPVVSLLSLDHQQEKDLLSMQSGRRRKPPPSTPPAVQVHHHPAYGMPPPPPQLAQVQHHQPHTHTNGYAPAYAPEYHYAQILAPPVYNSHSHPAAAPSTQKAAMTNGWSLDANANTTNTSSTKRGGGGWNSYPLASGHSSPRTDLYTPVDDSRANVSVDDKRRYSQPNLLPRHQYTTHRPNYNYNHNSHAAAAYGGGGNAMHRRRVFIPSGKTQYRNSNRPQQQQQHYDNNNVNTHTNGTPPPPPPPPPLLNHNNNNINNNHTADSKTTAARSTPSPGAFVSQMQAIPQHFVAPARHRTRRTVRRGGGIGECGAGDAPLTNNADGGVVDACHKMDSLKL